ncbi:hypothetical protein ACS0TY_006162 [Phlomoides rotata]
MRIGAALRLRAFRNRWYGTRVTRCRCVLAESDQFAYALAEPWAKLVHLVDTGFTPLPTLEIVAENPDKFRVVALAAGSNVTLLADQVKAFKPQLVSVRDESLVNELKEALSGLEHKPEIIPGEQGIIEVTRHPDAVTVVTGIVGCAGLKPTVAAIEAGKDIALANKETLIAGGPFVLPLAHNHNVKILPADSGHSAIFQFLPQDRVCEFAKLTPVQLLEETEKAVGDPQLPIQHQDLIKKSQELKKCERSKSLDQLKVLNAELEKDVERVRQREDLLAKVQSMKEKLPWLKYDLEKAEYVEAKKQADDAKLKLGEAAKALHAVKEPIACSYHLDTVELTDILSNFPDISVVLIDGTSEGSYMKAGFYLNMLLISTFNSGLRSLMFTHDSSFLVQNLLCII